MTWQANPIKPASTATVSTDPAVVVALHPLSPLPTGANTIGTVSVGNFPASQAVTGTGTVATPAAGVVTVQGIAGGAAQPVSGNVGVTALPALPAGTNSIGSVNPDTNVAAVGLAALNATAQVTLNGHGSVIMNVSGTFSATVSFQGLLPDGTWTAIYGYNGLDGGRITGLFSGAAAMRFVASGLRAIRAILTAYTSGTATVSLEASYAQTPSPTPAVVVEGNAYADGTTSIQILGRTAGAGAAAVSKVPILDATGAWVMGAGNNIIGQVKEYRAANSTVTRVASLATTATLLAANANRSGATFYNESTSILYLKLGATASLTSYTRQVAAGASYDVPAYYSGIIDGLWSAAQGAVQVTEIS